MSEPIFIDCETTSLAGICVIIQYAEGDGPIIIEEIWKQPIKKTLNLIEKFVNHEGGLVFFNAVFDFFHLIKIYTTFSLYHNHEELPINIVNQLGILEKEARDGLCLKPKRVLDLMLVARKTKYQYTMPRKDIRIKKVPFVLAQPLADELEKRIKLKPILFAKRKKKYEPLWKVFDHKLKDGTIDPEFRDIVLKFNPSNSLKALAADALELGDDDILFYDDISIDKELYSDDIEYAPFALAVAPGYLETRDWKKSWPAVIKIHVQHWATNSLARRYASNDVDYTRRLFKFFDCPAFNDDDSVLACLVAACRWKGFRIDLEGIQQLRDEAIKLADSAPKAPAAVREYIYNDLSETERVVLRQDSKLNETTKKIILEEISEFTEDCECVKYSEDNELISDPKCEKCKGTGRVYLKAALKAQEVLDARLAQYEKNFYEKLLLAGRLHADYNIIGALSSRMSGASDLNVQGIKKSKKVRKCFPLAFPPNVLCIGDFISFEVVLADAAWNDPDLRKELQTVIDCPFCENGVCPKCNGQDFNCVECKGFGKCSECKGSGKHAQTIHGLYGTFIYPGKSYIDILKTKGTAADLYTRSKSFVFLKMYGGTEHSAEDRLGIPLEVGIAASERFDRKFKKVSGERNKITEKFCSLSQPEGIGTRIFYKEPADYQDTIFGFKRYFTLENSIIKALVNIAEKPPEKWSKLKVKVTRRDRLQTVGGAVRSAVYAAAFNLQSIITRAATNHLIQGSGASVTKALQCKLWQLQPIGINEWRVQLLNIHDEVPSATHPDEVKNVTKAVNEFVEEMRKIVPLLDIAWIENAKSWAEK